MKAVVLAAGKGTRIRPLSETVPKPMLPVADRPLAAHAVDAAIGAGADEVVLVVGYEADVVRNYFGDSYRDVPVSYAVQTEQNGTADAVDAVRRAGLLEGPFAVLNGDNLYDPAAIERLFERAPAVGAVEVENPRNYGVLSTDDGTISGIVEKPDDPPTNLANAGAYAFPAKAREWLEVPASERGEREITDVLARVIEEFAVTPVTVDRWMDVGRPWELLEANEWKIRELDRRIDGEVSDSAHLEGDVVVEAGATVKPGVVIEGPALIRSGATVGPNAYVRGATLIGENASVGNAVEIKNSVLSAGTSVSHLSYVGDSVLGRDVNFGAGTTVANLRHDDADVKFTVKGDRVSTGRRKFGVVAGDGVKTGINTSLTPGLRLDAGATTRPGETVDRDR
ncbi:glucose-1-phosphate thymidylyltransferase [Halobiforma lacisalsi AJ5]|uniref:Bifunctional protein GlmU n=2 Tax=Natronobacterium TaxID=2256 RepID=M0LB90_NATLA|nr:MULTISPECIES: bifunctional sugar-1-phosphate nucleotidylyltransferase/acetyltransferase [Halobiforma]APW99261.1 glucose-1-phosphate thymidylyltransferase [Halobiforma lacisalsi AJ5]EMA30832.1 glucosamine-1-phosphate N-acetyltransferase [Halobiforma lacisalsi AJ5]SFB94187.1 bifunctional UDP-N-acetylglucosamine pyrophosphorylase / Glucosamine-1-phosphate N-acetyltransferase [Halobiforma haloterrestris]